MNNENEFEYLLKTGALQESGIDENTGEVLYTFTAKMKDIAPELYKEHLNSINAEIMYFWEMGFVNIDLLSDDPIVTLSEKSFNIDEILKLSDDKQWVLHELKRVLRRA